METCRVLFEYNSVEEDEISLPVDEVYQGELLLKEIVRFKPFKVDKKNSSNFLYITKVRKVVKRFF